MANDSTIKISELHQVYGFVCVLASSVSFLLNALLLICLLWFKALKETQNVITFHLVLSSLGMTVTCVCVVYLKAQYLVLDVSIDGLYNSSMAYLCAMSIWNYRSNMRQAYGGGIKIKPAWRVKQILLSCLPWLLSLAITCPPLFGFGSPLISLNRTRISSHLPHTIAAMSTYYLGPVLVKGFCSLKLFVLLKSYDKSTSETSVAQRKLQIRATKARKSLLKRNAIFLLCCSPLTVHQIVVVMTTNDEPVSHSVFTLLAIMYIFAVPILHGGILDKAFRAKLKKGVKNKQKRVVKVTSRVCGRRQIMDLSHVNTRDQIRSAEMILEKPPTLYHKIGLPEIVIITDRPSKQRDFVTAAAGKIKKDPASVSFPSRNQIAELSRQSQKKTMTSQKRVDFGHAHSAEKTFSKKYCSTPSLKRMRRIQKAIAVSLPRDLEPTALAQRGVVKRTTSRRARLWRLLSMKRRGRHQIKRCQSMHRSDQPGKTTKLFFERRCSHEGHDAICKPKKKV